MKKLSKIKLQDAAVLENKEMKAIYGGSGGIYVLPINPIG
ncbi:MAG: TIGR04149 family rSAM-modified RiPP [Oscillospiraceae bacterium]